MSDAPSPSPPAAAAPAAPAPAARPVFMIALRVLVGYFLISALTLPLLDKLWLGEIPLLAVLQLPKLALAKPMIDGAFLPVIQGLHLAITHWTAYVLARSGALALAYSIVLGSVLALIGIRSGGLRPYRRWIWALLAAAALDYCSFLAFANHPGLSIW